MLHAIGLICLVFLGFGLIGTVMDVLESRTEEEKERHNVICLVTLGTLILVSPLLIAFFV